jgi:hypothetical protein
MSVADLVTPIVFVGASRGSEIEALIADAQEAIARDTLERLLQGPEFAAPIVATSSAGFARWVGDLPVRVVLDEGAFHFGRALARVIRDFDVRRAFYLGGGSAPLLGTADFARVAELLLEHEPALVANNFFSADFVAFSPAAAIEKISLPTIDNDLAFRLQRETGLTNVPLPRSPATQMDLDTPTDLLILALHPAVGPHLRRFLDRLDLDLDRIRAASRFFTDPTAEIIVSGRVGPHLWSSLDTDLACRTRVFSEERGMRASGREERGEVRSLLGLHLQAVGAERLFGQLAELGDAAFIDSRVVFTHLGLKPSAADRFHSDLLRFEEIQNPIVRDFTRAAAHAPIPVVLGGHSLVSGGLWTLIDAAWRKRDEELGLAR